MATKVLVPRLGEGVDEVTVTKWLKQVGDSIKELEPLLEVNTDKVDTEIPAPATGTILKIVLQEGTPAKVGELLAIIGAPGENVEGVSTTPESKVGSRKSEPRKPKAMPRVYRRVKSHLIHNLLTTTNYPPPTMTLDSSPL